MAKYSVYSDIVLLDCSGAVRLRLDDSVAVARSEHALVRDTLETTSAYVETFGAIDLLPGQDRSLVYSCRVADSDGAILGVLCLCFRFDNEMAGIFSKLCTPEDWSVVTLLDDSGEVIASSDRFQIPLGAHLEPVAGVSHRLVRFGAQQYLAVSRTSLGYQGYGGPGWTGHVMLPLQHAFESHVGAGLDGLSRELMQLVTNSAALFGPELRRVPLQAAAIQGDLNRSVWNGNVRESHATQGGQSGFSKVLLWEISNTGKRTKDVFERSIANLQETVVSAILQDSGFQAALAIDIMDRNLYERANDCRWWALTSEFRRLLDAPEPAPDAADRIAAILAYINGLYTVYTTLVVFDAEGCVLAMSNPGDGAALGRPVAEEWARRTFALADAQGYVVSAYAPSRFYAGRPTYIYSAAIRSLDGARVVGGVGIVFDAGPQFEAMLRDTLPRDAAGQIQPGAFGLFVSRSGEVIACSDTRFAVGEHLPEPLLRAALESAGKSTVVELAGNYYAMGICASSGYREYKGLDDPYRNDVLALVLVPLCEVQAQLAAPEAPRPAIQSDRSGDRIEIATFRIGQEWYGVRASEVLESIDTAGLTEVPGAGPDLAGYLRYEDIPVPVFQVRHILRSDQTPEPVQPGQQVVMLRRSDTSRFGLLVDALGEIPEVAVNRLSILPDMLAGGCVLADAILPVDSSSERLLLVLSVDRIHARLAPSVREPLLRLAKTANQVRPVNA